MGIPCAPWLRKISEISPWVSKINWCRRHLCGSIYMVVRLSDIRSKTGKKIKMHFLCFFACFRPYVAQPDIDNHIGWATLILLLRMLWYVLILTFWLFLQATWWQSNCLKTKRVFFKMTELTWLWLLRFIFKWTTRLANGKESRNTGG